MIELGRITPESCAPYGRVLAWNPAQGQLQVAMEELAGAP